MAALEVLLVGGEELGVADWEPGWVPSAGHGWPGASWNLAACAAATCLSMELPFCRGCQST
jgi:hypothetical protein